MGDLNFNRKQCLRALATLGFLQRNQRNGSHDKFDPPETILEKVLWNQPHFIMIPRHKELHCQSEIISELRKMGGEDLVSKFKENL